MNSRKSNPLEQTSSGKFWIPAFAGMTSRAKAIRAAFAISGAMALQENRERSKGQRDAGPCC